MREITSHQVNGLNEALIITVHDEPGQGGACHRYEITHPAGPYLALCHFKFQEGPIAEAGVNGISNEALLAIVADRLEGFQSGPFACTSNMYALEFARLALARLQERTSERTARGVEGTSEV